MNAAQRKNIEALRAKFADLASQLESLKDSITTEQEAEQEKFDNMPEGLQQGEKGQAIEMSADKLSEAVSAVESAIESLEEADNAMEEATGS